MTIFEDKRDDNLNIRYNRYAQNKTATRDTVYVGNRNKNQEITIKTIGISFEKAATTIITNRPYGNHNNRGNLISVKILTK